jgi:hypothetical protein
MMGWRMPFVVLAAVVVPLGAPHQIFLNIVNTCTYAFFSQLLLVLFEEKH